MSTLEEDPQGTGDTLNVEELANDWHDLLGRYHRTQCALDRALSSEHHITVSDFEVLQQLHHAECGNLRMHDLAAQVHLTQSALSRLVTRLERAGLITRGVCSDDRRAAWTEITPAGTETYLAARPTHRAILLDIAAGGVGVCDEDTGASFPAA